MVARVPKTFFVGAGPVATALAGAMRGARVPVLGLWARRPEQARAAAAVAGITGYSAAPPDVLLEADVIVLAVRDDAIEEVANMLIGTGLVTPKHVLVHCSGARPAQEAFASVGTRVAGVATLHPLRAIADAKSAMQSMAGTVFGIEGDEVGRREALALAEAMGARPLPLLAEQMAAYHAAASMASNFLVAIMDSAAEVLTSAGVDATAALAALLPLASGSLANIERNGIEQGLTGPIRRGDYDTVRRHKDVLPERLWPIYQALGARTVEIAQRLDTHTSDDLDRIAALLCKQSAHGDDPAE